MANWRCRRGAHDTEVVDVLRGERVFQEEKVVRLQVLGEADRLDGRDTLMKIVQQLHGIAELRAQVVEQARRLAHIGRRLEDLRMGRDLAAAGDRLAATGTIRAIAADRLLATDEAIALVDIAGADAVGDLLLVAAADVRVQHRRFTAFAAE